MKKLKFILLSYSVLFWFLLISDCQKKSVAPQEIIATINDQPITLSEFRLFYELDPNFGIDSTGFNALRDELDKLICYKLSYIKADEDGLLQDSLLRIAREWELSRAMLRELYRQVIEAKVQVSDEEIKKAFLENSIRVHVRHLFSRDSLQILHWREQLKEDGSFEELAHLAFHDTLLARNGGDLGWVKISELDSQFAAAVKLLKKDEISSPVKTKWGYHIIHLIDRVDEVTFSEDEFAKQKQLLSRKIFSRKSREFARDYVAEYVGKKFNPQPDPKVFQKLWRAVTRETEAERSLHYTVTFTNEMIKQLKWQLGENLQEPLITYKGGSITLGEYLESMSKIPMGNRPRVRTRGDLSHKLAVWVRDELLLREAFKRRLDRHPTVRKEVQQFMEKQLYFLYLQQVLMKIDIPQEVTDYFSKVPRPANAALRKFHTLQEWKWWKAERELMDKLRLLSVEVKIDSTLLREENRQIDWQSRIRLIAFPRPE